jgi:hypothetical protein
MSKRNLKTQAKRQRELAKKDKRYAKDQKRALRKAERAARAAGDAGDAVTLVHSQDNEPSEAGQLTRVASSVTPQRRPVV